MTILTWASIAVSQHWVIWFHIIFREANMSLTTRHSHGFLAVSITYCHILWSMLYTTDNLCKTTEHADEPAAAVVVALVDCWTTGIEPSLSTAEVDAEEDFPNLSKHNRNYNHTQNPISQWPKGKTCLYKTLTRNDFLCNNVVYSGNWRGWPGCVRTMVEVVF